MSVPDHKLSSSIVDAPYIPPEEEFRLSPLTDMEGGPVAVGNTTGGMNYQPWDLSVVGNDIILTPRNEGLPITVLSVEGLTQASFCFDQNARPSVAYKTSGGVFLYWYDTDAANFVTTPYPDAVSAILSLDDKRERQVNNNDIIFWYTKEVSPGVYHLFNREQRDRFTEEYRMEVSGVPPEVPPVLWKAGMHQGLRGKITLKYA